MQRLVLLFAAATVALVAMPHRAFAQTWTDFDVGGLTRKALVYVPSGIDEPPLLISLHGMGIGAGWHQGGMMKFEPIADREKFIVVYPEADQDLRWDLGGTHDLDFIDVIIEQMAAQHGIDRNRVYASGFSMGGMFSYTLACKMPDKIAAIAPGDGYPLGGLFGCTPGRPVPIFHMHGTADDFVKYSGIHEFLSGLVTQYGCPATPQRTEPYPASNPASMSFSERWGPCMNGDGLTSEIVLVSVTGMIHDWATAGKPNANEDPAFTGKPFDIDGSEEAWAFLKQHSLDQPSAAGVTDPNGSPTDPAAMDDDQPADDAGALPTPTAPPLTDPAMNGSAGSAGSAGAPVTGPQPQEPTQPTAAPPADPVVLDVQQPSSDASGGCSVGARGTSRNASSTALLLLAVTGLALRNRARRPVPVRSNAAARS
jgi:poly(3-hydroxybutyrate) depolymerase